MARKYVRKPTELELLEARVRAEKDWLRATGRESELPTVSQRYDTRETATADFVLNGGLGQVTIQFELPIPNSSGDNSLPTPRQIDTVAWFYHISATSLSSGQAHILMSVCNYARALSKRLAGASVWRQDMCARLIALEVLKRPNWLQHAIDHSDYAFNRHSYPEDWKPGGWRTFPEISAWWQNEFLPNIASNGVTLDHLRQPIMDLEPSDTTRSAQT